jgi:hypothetical protein
MSVPAPLPPIYSTNNANNILLLNENVKNACLQKLKSDYCQTKVDALTRKSPLLITQPSTRPSVRTPVKIVKWNTPLVRNECQLYDHTLPPIHYIRNPNPSQLDLQNSDRCKCPK